MPAIMPETPQPWLTAHTECGQERVFDTIEDYYDYSDCGCGNGIECCGDRFCDSCHDRDDDDDDEENGDDYDGLLRYYSYTPDPLIFYGGDQGTEGVPFYGMEIEVTCNRSDPIRWAKTAFNKAQGGRDNLCYFKSDGSVAGFELVTHPMTYPWALEHFPWEHLAELKTQGCTIRPGDNGIHVHVSRSGFDSDAHAYRWFKVLYRNQPDVLRIARRETSWAKFTADHRKGQFAHLKAQKGALGNGDIDNRLYQRENRYYDETDALLRRPENEFIQRGLSRSRYTVDQEGLYYTYERRLTQLRHEYERDVTAMRRERLEDTTRRDRYSAVNTGNAYTFEVRLFASTLDPVAAQSTIGLVSATVEYTRHLTARQCIKDGALDWPAFRKWLEDQPLYAAVRVADANCTGGRARSTIG